MTDKDVVVFRLIPEDELANPNTFCHYGWDGIGALAFSNYANAYFDSAEILFEKFLASAGHNDILDGTGMTMCFLYRHFVELSIKYLYLKFACTGKDDFKQFLTNGHNLMSLWHATKPKLSELKKRVGASVDLSMLEHYIRQFDKFDPDEMTMRYPVKNNLKPTKKAARLDIINLHERVNELYWAFYGIARDLDNQMNDEVEDGKIDSFINWYDRLRPRMLSILESLAPLADTEFKGIKWLKMREINPDNSKWMKQMELLRSCTDDEIIMLDCLYYTGRFIGERLLRLPKNPHDARIDAAKMCVENLERDHLEFGKPKNDEINVYSKTAAGILRCVPKVMKAIDWDKQDVKDRLDTVEIKPE